MLLVAARTCCSMLSYHVARSALAWLGDGSKDGSWRSIPARRAPVDERRPRRDGESRGAGAAPFARGAARFAVAPEAPPDFGAIADSPLLDAYSRAACSRRSTGWTRRAVRPPGGFAVAGAATPPDAAALGAAASPPSVRRDRASPTPDPAPTALADGARAPHRSRLGQSAWRRRLARRAGRDRRLLRGARISSRSGSDATGLTPAGRAALAQARARRRGRPRPVRLRAAPKPRAPTSTPNELAAAETTPSPQPSWPTPSRRAVPASRPRASRRLRRRPERRRSWRGARRNRRGGRPRRAARRFQPAAEGLPRPARRIEAPGRSRAGAAAARAALRLGPRRALVAALGARRRRRVPRRGAGHSTGPARPKGARAKRLAYAASAEPPWPAPAAPARRDSRQHGDVALGAARHGRAPHRGQHPRLFGRGARRRHRRSTARGSSSASPTRRRRSSPM